MEAQKLNLFIVDDNKLMVAELRIYLNGRFGNILNISTFYTGKSALEKIDKDTSIVILDYFLDGENGNDVLKSIKDINPNTEVIMLSSNENVAIAIESIQKGASEYLVKGDRAWRKLIPLIYHTITEPIRRMGREYGLPKFIFIMLAVFVLMGLGVALILKLIHH